MLTEIFNAEEGSENELSCPYDLALVPSNLHAEDAPNQNAALQAIMSGDTQFHMTIGRVSKRFNPRTHAVMMPLSQVTIGRTSKPLNLRLFAVTMVLSQVTIGRTSKPFDLRVPIFPLIIIQPLLVG